MKASGETAEAKKKKRSDRAPRHLRQPWCVAKREGSGESMRQADASEGSVIATIRRREQAAGSYRRFRE